MQSPSINSAQMTPRESHSRSDVYSPELPCKHASESWQGVSAVISRLLRAPTSVRFYARPDPNGWVKDSEGGLLY